MEKSKQLVIGADIYVDEMSNKKEDLIGRVILQFYKAKGKFLHFGYKIGFSRLSDD